MGKRVFSREFKLSLMNQIESGQKQVAQIRQEYSLDESLVSRWRKEYRERGEDAFLPKKMADSMTQEQIERKRTWDRNYYQRHKIERQVANNERRAKLSEFLQQIKAKARCIYCGENHPAVLQFHHRDPSQKEFAIAEFITRQIGGIERLKKEIEKCDIVCANCHLKYHYEHAPKRSRTMIETITRQFEQEEQE